MAGGSVILCEQTTYWATAWRRELDRVGLALREIRLLRECDAELAAVPAGVLVIEIERRDPLRALRGIVSLRQRYPRALVIAVARRGLESAKWSAMEAGAACFTCSPRQLRPAAELAARHAKQHPQPETGLLAGLRS
jgi:hypothetical protein